MSLRLIHIGLRGLFGSLGPAIAVSLLCSGLVFADNPPGTAPATSPAVAPADTAAQRPIDTIVAPDLLNRTVQEVRVTGNAQVSSQVILNVVRTHVGDKFDPATVEEDYQRIYTLKRFSNVEARVEPTATGVIVIFEVTEEKLIRSIQFVGNKTINNEDLRKDIDLTVGEAIEPFRIALARRAIITALRAKNHPFAHVEVDMNLLTSTGNLVFRIVEGSPVTVEKIQFIGNKSFTANELDLFGKLNDQIKTRRWIFIFDPGNYDPQTVEEDVAALRHFYQSEGFFDVKVGRKLIFSPDQTEVEIDYLIDEGPRYKVARVEFEGNTKISGAVLRKNMELLEGAYFDSEKVDHDVKEIVRAYSPLGYVYQPFSNDPAYLQVGKPQNPWVVHLVWHKEPGTVDLIYEISEGRPFHTGIIHIKGNQDTQDKVILRQLHVQPGQLYDSGELNDATDRLKALPNFSNVNISPIGNTPDTRDVLVDVTEKQTTKISVGGQVTSNLGLGGNLTYEQKNFDITKFPSRLEDLWSGDRAFEGAGQDFIATFQPGINFTNAEISFTEPYVNDWPITNTDEVHYEQTYREAWYERRLGGSVNLGYQFNTNWGTSVSLGADDWYIGGIDNYYPVSDRVDLIDPVTRLPIVNANGKVETQLRSDRAPEILEDAGHNPLTDIGWTLRYDSTNPGVLTYKGLRGTFNYQYFGAMGGDYHFSKFTAGVDQFDTLFSDTLDRKTILHLHLDGGYITPDAPFFERFYGGGLGGMRGFEYRGISPQSGRANDPVGGDFAFYGTTEVGFPIYGDNFRGVVFNDVGTVEQDIRIHTIRDSVGCGVRVVLPFLSPAPLAFDVGFPVHKGPQDTQQVFSFGFGFSR